MFDGFADKTKYKYKEEFYQQPNYKQMNNKDEQSQNDNVSTNGVLSEKVLFDEKASQLRLGELHKHSTMKLQLS
jgi:hypothetical protein